jgi:hypothetical protein
MYKNNMQMKAQCQMHGQKEAHCQEQIRQKPHVMVPWSQLETQIKVDHTTKLIAHI